MFLGKNDLIKQGAFIKVTLISFVTSHSGVRTFFLQQQNKSGERCNGEFDVIGCVSEL